MSIGAARPATHARLYEQAPDVVEADGTRSWVTRARNFAVVVSQTKPGTVLERNDNPDESMLVLAPGVGATIEAGTDRADSVGDSLTILPPGGSRMTVRTGGTVARIFSDRATDVMAVANNRATYADGAPEVAPIKAWPDPVGGFRLRHYPLAQYDSPDPSPLKMRVFRSTNLMINIFLPWTKRRDEFQAQPAFARRLRANLTQHRRRVSPSSALPLDAGQGKLARRRARRISRQPFGAGDSRPGHPYVAGYWRGRDAVDRRVRAAADGFLDEAGFCAQRERLSVAGSDGTVARAICAKSACLRSGPRPCPGSAA